MSMKILLAEDDPDHQDLLRLALTESAPDLLVQVAASGEETLRALRCSRGGFDCVIMDFNLPDRRADQVLRRLASDPDHPPVIVVSSGKSQSIVIDSLRNGSVDFVPKEDAITSDFLWKRVQSAVSTARKASQERRRSTRRAQRLVRLAEVDPLTGLSNRRTIDRYLNDHGPTLDRRGRPSVVMIDLDHFKRINDVGGHAAGDRVLCATAEVIKAHCAPGDLACRWGGEEFVVVRPAASLAATVLWAEGLRQKLERQTDDLGIAGLLTASVGVVASPGAKLTRETIVAADRAMYLAKSKGRNRVCTSAMVAFDRVLTLACGQRAESLEGRFHRLVELAQPILGPAQREHMASQGRAVQRIALRLADELRLGPGEFEELGFAALAHDVGSALIPEETLAKRGPLSTQERAFVGYHAGYGAEIAQGLGAAANAVECIRHHHTRFDAKSDTEASVPQGAMIIAAADAFMAMTNPRPYKRARSIEDTIGEMRRCRGGQFDPCVVDALPRAVHAFAS